LNGNLQLTREYVVSAIGFQREAERILSSHETSKSRRITIEQTYAQLGTLTVRQDRLLKQSLDCTSFSMFRAAHVLAWAALMDFLEQKLAEDEFVQLNTIRDKWKIHSVDDLRDSRSDYQIIEAIRLTKLCSKSDEKALKGLLACRNECAHPGEYEPELNETLGYVSQILKRIQRFQKSWSNA